MAENGDMDVDLREHLALVRQQWLKVMPLLGEMAFAAVKVVRGSTPAREDE